MALSRPSVRLPVPRPTTVFGAAALAVLAWASLLALARAAPILALSFLAALFGSLLSLAIRRISPPLPRALATLLVLGMALGIVAAAGWLALPTVIAQGRELLAQLPSILDAALAALRSLFAGRGLGEEPSALAAELRSDLAHRLASALGSAVPFASAALATVFGSFATITVAGFLAYRPDIYVDGFLRLVPPRHRPSFAVFVSRLGALVQRWILGALISMTAVGVLTAAGLWLLGIGPWFALAAFTFFAEFVPYLGPVISGVAAGTVALAKSPELALWVALLYVAVQQLESNLITPLVMKRVVRLQPALLLVWQLVLGVLFGLPGVIVATPLLACVQLAVQHFYLEPREARGQTPPPEGPGHGSGSGTTSGEAGGTSGPAAGRGAGTPGGPGSASQATSTRDATCRSPYSGP